MKDLVVSLAKQLNHLDHSNTDVTADAVLHHPSV
jgi:hypothetical protein